MPLAPERFVEWMTNNKHEDKKLGQIYRYHSRSDSHSKAICLFILEDLLQVSTTLKEHAAAGKVVYKTNLPYLWANSAKAKTIDLAIGLSIEGVASNSALSHDGGRACWTARTVCSPASASRSVATPTT